MPVLMKLLIMYSLLWEQIITGLTSDWLVFYAVFTFSNCISPFLFLLLYSVANMEFSDFLSVFMFLACPFYLVNACLPVTKKTRVYSIDEGYFSAK